MKRLLLAAALNTLLPHLAQVQQNACRPVMY
jgi:hypothetical protein